MKIICFELEKWEEDYIQEKLPSGISMTCFDHSIRAEDLSSHADAQGLIIFIYSKITKEILDVLPQLKFITTMSTGFDHIDLEECNKRGIVVSNVSGYGETTVAEHTFALLLAISRRIIESYERVKEGYFSPENLTGFDLFGKTLGVVGIGSIGKHVIKIANGFGMNVIGYKRSLDPELEKELGFKIVDMDTLLKTSDIISLHLPYSSETHHIINEEAFEKMKNGVVILNTARGPLIDTHALLKNVERGKVGGVGLDVCESEPLLREEKQILSKEFNKEDLLCLLEEKMLLIHKNVILTPHNAFNSREALLKILNTTTENITGFLENKPQNVVSQPVS